MHINEDLTLTFKTFSPIFLKNIFFPRFISSSHADDAWIPCFSYFPVCLIFKQNLSRFEVLYAQVMVCA